MYWCPYSKLEVLDLYSLVLPSLGRIEVVIPTILWLASFGFIIHFLHPSITSQLCFSPTYYLTCGMEDLSLLEPLLDKPPQLFVSRLWAAEDVFAYRKQVALPSIQCIWRWNEYLWKAHSPKVVFFNIHEWKASLMKLALKNVVMKYFKALMKSSVFQHTWMQSLK